MVEATNNPIDLDMFSNLQANSEVQSTNKTQNPEISFLQKCIHPPSAVPGYIGLPTNDARTQVNVQWRNVNLMKTPYIYDTGTTRAVTPADLQTFDYAILSTNGAKVLSIPFIYNAPQNRMTQDLNNVDKQDAFDFDRWQDEANLYRPAYKSLTTYLNATAFNNTGLVVGNQFNPNILFAGTLLTMAMQQPEMFYDYIKCNVKSGYHKKLSIRDKGYSEFSATHREVPNYIKDEIARIAGLGKDEIIDLDPNTTIQVVNIGLVGETAAVTVVPTASQLLNNSMRSYAGKALEGTFSVQRLNTIAPSWCAGSNTNNGLEGLYQCWSYTKDSAGVVHINPILDNAALGEPNPPTLTDTLWTKDMTWSWTLYQGLSLNSQTSTSMQLLIKKYYTGFEVQPTPRSAWSGMTMLGPKPDIKVLQLMMDAFYELKDTMPAKYNFWGTLGSIAASVLPHAVGLVKDFIQPKAAAPQRAQISHRKQAVAEQIETHEAAEVLDVDHKVDALNKKMDRMTLARPKIRRAQIQTAPQKPRQYIRRPPVRARTFRQAPRKTYFAPVTINRGNTRGRSQSNNRRVRFMRPRSRSAY